jgi:hypothetical protein
MLWQELGPCGSDGGSEFVKCGGQPELLGRVDRERVVATAEVLDEGVPSDHHARRSMVFSPRIGLSRAFSRPWSHSTRLFRTGR